MIDFTEIEGKTFAPPSYGTKGWVLVHVLSVGDDGKYEIGESAVDQDHSTFWIQEGTGVEYWLNSTDVDLTPGWWVIEDVVGTYHRGDGYSTDDDEEWDYGSVRPATIAEVRVERPDLAPFEDIKDFHEKYKLTHSGSPRHLPPDLEEFRIKFMQEELAEYVEAGDLHGKLDALVDLVYVVLGTAYLHGFDFDEAWRRVHDANMKKVRAVRAEDSKRGSTHDVVKPDGWQPPDLSDLVKP